MHCPSLFIAALAGLVTAAPTSVARRQTAEVTVTDVDILNYALTLEHLEATFYKQGLAMFAEQDFITAGFDSTFFTNVQVVASDESTHVDFLTSAITSAGATAVAACTYNFGITDVETFVATASILEGVGVSAYLGAAALILEKMTLTAAASILTVESRHSAVLRSAQQLAPVAQPFDVPLSLNEVFTLAAAFIVSCPSSNPALPVKAFPSLKMGGDGKTKVSTGVEIIILTPGFDLVASSGDSLFAAFITVTGPVSVKAVATEGGFTTTIPEGVSGQSYVVLTASENVVTDDVVAAGPLIIEIIGSSSTSSGSSNSTSSLASSGANSTMSSTNSTSSK